MQKQAPSIGRILVAVGFTLSCFALLLFLWVTFGGPTPFKPESYRFTADFPEAITLAKEADVRIGGVSVGKVKDIEPGARERVPKGSDHVQHHPCDDRDRPAVRADLVGRQGDPALEDAARGDLRRADERQPDTAESSRTRARPLNRARSTSGSCPAPTHPSRFPRADTSPRRRSRIRPRSTRSSRASTSRRGRRSSPGCRTRPRGQRPRPRPERRVRQPRSLRLGRERRARHPAQPGAVAAHAGPRHRRRLRGAHGARPGARRGGRRRQPDLRRARLAEQGAVRHLQDLPDLREREPADARPAEAVRRGRLPSSTTSGRSRAI